MVFAVVLALAFIASVALWILAPRLAPQNRVFRRLVVRIGKWSLGLSAVGLLLLLFRWQIVPFFSKRIWLFLWFASVAGGIGYVAFYWKRLYPARLVAWEARERRQRYLPRSGGSGSRGKRRSRQRR